MLTLKTGLFLLYIHQLDHYLKFEHTGCIDCYVLMVNFVGSTTPIKGLEVVS
jgi:hypothetical protein